MNDIKRKLVRRRGDRWCKVEVMLSTDGRLSICGEEGRIVTRVAAKRKALAYWCDFFDENPAELADMNRRHNKRFTSTGAAKFVLECDGALHGLDVSKENGREVWLLESGGQIREVIAKWFPEVAPYLKHHLNGMKAGCEHQEAEGWDERPIDPSKPLDAYGLHFPGQKQMSWNMLVWVRPDEHPEGLLTKSCPTCGYKYGTEWKKRELPASVATWAQSFGEAA
jgi:hypothetical protein